MMKETPNFSGQHLMTSKKLIHEIVDQANISSQDLVLDLGAGKGALTTVLSEKAGKVLAIECDRKYVEILNRKSSQYPNMKVIHQDILKMKLPKRQYIVVSNIPYSITTPIMKMLLNKPASGFQRGVIVMEKGAAKRFTSNFVKDPYVIAWRMWFDIRYVRGISRKHFVPSPKVDSAMVTIHRKVNPMVPMRDYLIFCGLAHHLLKNPSFPIDLALRGVFTVPQIKRLKRNLEINNEIPVAILTERQWGTIFETMVKYVAKFKWPKMK